MARRSGRPEMVCRPAIRENLDFGEEINGSSGKKETWKWMRRQISTGRIGAVTPHVGFSVCSTAAELHPRLPCIRGPCFSRQVIAPLLRNPFARRFPVRCRQHASAAKDKDAGEPTANGISEHAPGAQPHPTCSPAKQTQCGDSSCGVAYPPPQWTILPVSVIG